MFYEEIFKKLAEEKIDYLVVGGVALVIHGALRFTADLDLMLLPKPKNLHKFISALNSLGYKPKLPIFSKNLDFELLKNWKKTRNMQVLSFYNSDEPLKLIDMLIDPVIDYKTASKDAIITITKKAKIPIISINNLIKLKKEAGRPKDLEDIASLNKLLSLKDKNGKK